MDLRGSESFIILSASFSSPLDKSRLPMLSFKGQSAQMQQQMISFHLAQIRWFVFFCTSQLLMVSFFQKLKTEPLNSTRCMCGTSLLWNGSHCVRFYWRQLPCVSTLSPDIFVHAQFLSLPDAEAQHHNSTESRSVKKRVRNKNQIIRCIFKKNPQKTPCICHNWRSEA